MSHSDHEHHEHDHHHGHSHHGHHHHGSRPPKPGILLAAFGVAIDDARSGYDSFMERVAAHYPGVELALAYTAHKVRRKMRKKGLECDSMAEALCRLHDAGVTHLAVQSLHTSPGVEYNWTLNQAMAYLHPRKGFEQVTVGGPLLMTNEDVFLARDALAGYIPQERTPDQAVVLVGHGTYHAGQQRYLDFQETARHRDPKLFVGTLMGEPGLDETLRALRAEEIGELWLLPFMCVPGHHVRVDVFGEGHSWLRELRKQGFAVHTHSTGTLEHPPFQDIWFRHLEETCAEAFPKEHTLA